MKNATSLLEMQREIASISNQERAKSRFEIRQDTTTSPRILVKKQLFTLEKKRRSPDSNRGITDLQSVALGHLATAPLRVVLIGQKKA